MTGEKTTSVHDDYLLCFLVTTQLRDDRTAVVSRLVRREPYLPLFMFDPVISSHDNKYPECLDNGWSAGTKLGVCTVVTGF